MVTLLHEKALELLAKCHADTTSDNPDMRKTSREEEVVFLKQLLSKCTCLNAYQACEHDGSDTALTVFPARKDDADTSKRSLALAMDVFHPADKMKEVLVLTLPRITLRETVRFCCAY